MKDRLMGEFRFWQGRGEKGERRERDERGGKEGMRGKEALGSRKTMKKK